MFSELGYDRLPIDLFDLKEKFSKIANDITQTITISGTNSLTLVAPTCCIAAVTSRSMICTILTTPSSPYAYHSAGGIRHDCRQTIQNMSHVRSAHT